MSYFSAAGNFFAPLTEGVTPTALFQGIYHDTGRFGPAPMASDPQYKDISIEFVDVDGVVHVRHGFRGRMIFATLAFAGSLSYCDSQSKTIMDALSVNPRYTVAMPGGSSYDGCKKFAFGQGSWNNVSGGCLFVVPCTFIQLSTTN